LRYQVGQKTTRLKAPWELKFMGLRALRNQHLRVASSASSASSFTTLKNSGCWPMNSRSSVKPWTAACAPKIFVEIETGRMIETFGKLPAEERARLGHDQIGLKVLPAEGRRIEVWERETAKCHIKRR
jgi:hypothetical protein